MKTMSALTLVASLSTLAAAAPATAPAQAPGADPVAVNAKYIQVKIDNPRVRVFESDLRPGDKEARHGHPATVVYVIAGGKIRNHLDDGTVKEVEYKTGDTVYRDPLVHWAENIGDTTLRVLIVELK